MDTTKVTGLEMGDFLKLSKWANLIIRILRREHLPAVIREGEDHKDTTLLASNMEESCVSNASFLE